MSTKLYSSFNIHSNHTVKSTTEEILFRNLEYVQKLMLFSVTLALDALCKEI